jgi:hypothetical protein
MQRNKLFQIGSMALLIVVFIISCKKEDVNNKTSSLSATTFSKKGFQGFAENDMVLYWNEKAAIVLNGPNTPPAQSRYFSMIQIAVHDALNSIKPKFETFALKNVRAKRANPDAAVASAAYWTIKEMNVQGANPIDDWYEESLATVPAGESKDLGIELGKQSANAIISNRSNDNFSIANQQLPGPDGVAPGVYRSTLPFSNPGMPKIKALSMWGIKMAPFVTQSNTQFRPVAPYPVNSPEYIVDYNEVKTKGARVGHTRTADEDEIGRFWVERSSISWNRLARNLIATRKMDSWKTARLFALLHTAMTDAISGCFEAKYHYLFWRPETAIRLGASDGIDNTVEDANWLPSYIESPNPLNPALNVNTPPIPDYPSAHATFGGAAAEILRLLFESNEISINQTSLTTPGVTRHYATLSQAARDNSLSRIYVGFHFRNSCLKGEKMGEDVARYVFDHSFGESGDGN